MFIPAINLINISILFTKIPKKGNLPLWQKLILESVFTLTIPLSMVLFSLSQSNINIYWVCIFLMGSLGHGLLTQPIVGFLSAIAIYSLALLFGEYPVAAFHDVKIVFEFSILINISSLFLKHLMLGGLHSKLNLKLHNSKLESLGHMAGGICHEINSPMMVIMGNVQLVSAYLEMLGVKNEKLTNSLTRISQQTERIRNIISSLNIYSEKSVVKLEDDKKLSEILYSIRNELKPKLLEENITLNIPDIEDKLLNEISVSESIMKQSLNNLLQNSIDAVKECENKIIDIECRRENDNIEIAVFDSGNGIDETISEKIMDPFFTTKEIGSGIGLGLNVVQGLVNSIDGELYHRRENNRTKFAITLKAS